MTKYKIILSFSDGEEIERDEIFDTEEAAHEYALYLVGCASTGAEILNMSNPGDYPLDDFEEPDYEIIESEEY